MPKEEPIKLPPTEQWLKRDVRESDNSTTETHPSYGVIGISRVSGHSALFNSSTTHQHFLKLSIKEARKVTHNGTHEFISGAKLLSEVHMTESQFAQFITQPNQGDGVPCTLHYNDGDSTEPWVNPRWGTRPDAPSPERFDVKFRKEASDRAQIISDNLRDLEAALDGFLAGTTKPGKGNLNDLKDKVSSARRQIDSNIPYVLEVAGEQIEKKVSSAIVEFESYVGQSLQAKGLAHMQTDAPRLALPTSAPLSLPQASVVVPAFDEYGEVPDWAKTPEGD